MGAITMAASLRDGASAIPKSANEHGLNVCARCTGGLDQAGSSTYAGT
jgi:hypothetical protein